MKLKRIKSTSAKSPDRSAIIAILTAGYERVSRQLMALAFRCQDPDGHVPCTVNFELTVRFMVKSEAERDAIVHALQREMAGRLSITASITTNPGRQIADLVARL